MAVSGDSKSRMLEAALRSSGLTYAILRPTVIWGGGRDVLLNNIAWCLRRFPVFLLPAGQYRIQPVHVDDLSALAVASAFEEANVVMDTAGPESYRFRDLVVLIREKLGVRCLILPAPGHWSTPWGGSSAGSSEM